MKLLKIVASDRPQKRYKAIFEQDNGRTKTTHFGDSAKQTYIDHHDKERRERYRSRHKKDLETGDPTRAGFLAYEILWGSSTSMDENIRHYKSKYGL